MEHRGFAARSAQVIIFWCIFQCWFSCTCARACMRARAQVQKGGPSWEITVLHTETCSLSSFCHHFGVCFPILVSFWDFSHVGCSLFDRAPLLKRQRSSQGATISKRRPQKVDSRRFPPKTDSQMGSILEPFSLFSHIA